MGILQLSIVDKFVVNCGQKKEEMNLAGYTHCWSRD
jgi:hypothetical protein